MLFSANIDGLQALRRSAADRGFQMPKHKGQADEAEPKKKKKWPWIVAATAVVVAGGVTAGVVLSQRAKDSGQPAGGGVTVNW